MNPSFYDRDYYEIGIESGKSNYQNYSWLPELTIPLAMTIIDLLGIKPKQSILEIGCAKGYLVKALRMLHRDAWGSDISDYALANVDSSVKAYCSKPSFYEHTFRTEFDFCIAKDVFEHIPVSELSETLKKIPASILFSVIPLGENGCYFAKANNLDKSHVICETAEWWINFFGENKWEMKFFSYHVPGIKDNYAMIPKAHGFFIHRKR